METLKSRLGATRAARQVVEQAKKILGVSTLEMPDGKLEQFLVAAEE